MRNIFCFLDYLLCLSWTESGVWIFRMLNNISINIIDTEVTKRSKLSKMYVWATDQFKQVYLAMNILNTVKFNAAFCMEQLVKRMANLGAQTSVLERTYVIFLSIASVPVLWSAKASTHWIELWPELEAYFSSTPSAEMRKACMELYLHQSSFIYLCIYSIFVHLTMFQQLRLYSTE